MPELPEVQTVVSDLNEKIKGDTITDFSSAWAKAIKGKTLAAFKKEIVGRKVLGARRIGKNIFIDLSGGKTLYLHLKMTGHLLLKTQKNFQFPIFNFQSNSKSQKYKLQTSKETDYFEDRVNQYIRHSWTLRNKRGRMKNLEFSDMRKFAKIVLDDTEAIANLPEISSLGIDAMDPDFNFKTFDDILNKKAKTPIGILLMDQNLIAGIGNIYRSEILYVAGILPERRSEELDMAKRKKIFQAIKSILKKAIKLRGTSDSDYRDTSGAPGGFQKILRVYGRDGKKCQKCGTIITRRKIGQRSVFSCQICQK
jgi:formamidopyrimidine-DNA glycosylase